MGLHQEQMDSIKVDSYKECVWYIPEIDKCKLPGICGHKYSKCGCKEEKMDEFCIWITKFIKSTPKDIEIEREKSEDVTDKYGFYVIDDDEYDASFLDKLSKILTGTN